MPPKRKAAPAEPSTRNTRSSKAASTTVAEEAVAPVASTSKAKPASKTKKAASSKKPAQTSKQSGSDISELEDKAPPKKKAKTSMGSSISSSKSAKAVVEIEDDSEDVAPVAVKKTAKAKAPAKKKAAPIKKSKKKKAEEEEVLVIDATPEAEPAPVVEPEPELQREVEDHSPFSMKKLEAFYKTYADPDNPNSIDGEGLEKLFSAANIPMDGIGPLVLPFNVKAKSMGKLDKAEFMELQHPLVDSAPKLRNFLRAMIVDVETSSFDEFYAWLYPFCLEEGQKSMIIDIGLALWGMLLAPKYPVAADFVTYLTENPKHKGVNKDTWTQVYEFVQEVTFGPESEGKPLIGFSQDAAFPVMIDEYAEWVARGRVAESKEEED